MIETLWVRPASSDSHRMVAPPILADAPLGFHHFHQRPSPWSENLSRSYRLSGLRVECCVMDSHNRRGAETLGRWEDGNGRRIGPIASRATCFRSPCGLPCLSRRRPSLSLIGCAVFSRGTWSWRFPALPRARYSSGDLCLKSLHSAFARPPNLFGSRIHDLFPHSTLHFRASFTGLSFFHLILENYFQRPRNSNTLFLAQITFTSFVPGFITTCA